MTYAEVAAIAPDAIKSLPPVRSGALLPVVHQSINGVKIACGANLQEVQSTPLCRDVTCPACLEWLDELMDAVFKPIDG